MYNNKQIEEYSRKIEEEPSSLLFMPLAEAYKNQGMIDNAINVCIKGLKYHPTLSRPRILLAELYLEKNLYNEAYDELNKVISTDQTNIMAHKLIELILRKQGKVLEADNIKIKMETIDRFGTPISEKTENEMLTPTLAELYFSQGLIKEAIEIYQKIAANQPANDGVKRRIFELQKELDMSRGISKDRLKQLLIPIKKTLNDLVDAIEHLEKEL